MRLAVIGGTFNPIHYGHLRAAEEVREALGVDKMLFIPACTPPHKADEPVVSPEARLEMTRLATEGNPFFEVSDMEVKRGGRSYTIETVRALKSERGPGIEVLLVTGSDSFNDITTWCEYEELVSLASFVVVARPGYAVKTPAEALPVELARKFWYDSSVDAFVNSGGNTITYLKTTLFDISSSEIRDKVKEGRSIRYLLPSAVERYISSNGLYR